MPTATHTCLDALRHLSVGAALSILVVVEVDVAHSSARKLAIYPQLGVPEVWRYDGERAVIYQRSGDGYGEIPHPRPRRVQP